MSARPEPKVPLASLPPEKVRALAMGVTDPEARRRIERYLDRRERSDAAKRKAKRSVQKSARKANRR